MAAAFSLSNVFRTGWEGTKQNFWFFAIALVISSAASYLPTLATKEAAGVLISLSLLALVIRFFVNLGMMSAALKITSHQKPSLADLYNTYPYAINILVSGIIVGVLTAVGFLLFIIPGVILVLRLWPTPFLILDRNLGPFDAVSQSWNLTKGSSWRILGFFIIAALLNAAGALAFVVGLFVTIPVTAIATASVYRHLTIRPVTPTPPTVAANA